MAATSRSSTIFIHDLRVSTRIGVYSWEAHMDQTVRLDLDIGAPSDRPFASGRFDDALDYAAVVARVKAYAAAHEHPLLERFAEGIAGIVRDEFNAPWVRVRVAKLGALPGVREIGVEIVR
ncbi:7,8-dihydroneopterin aldolase/epimerase/oxygenase [Burkholderiales bacterium]|nr:7,8-dihydroneopterin aldolase/epimerase/oxygenase [Burkholderiales bacterium]